MKKIFETAYIGQVAVKNRIVRSATWENMTTPTGHMTPELYKIYEDLAANEVGLILTGYANVVAEEQPNPGMMGIYSDDFIKEYSVLTERVHQHGAKIMMQLAYGGTKTTYRVGERVIFAPSDVPERGTKVAGKPMTLEEIQYIVTAFVKAAERAQKAGFDGVEIHGAHSYLINQFLSPYYNKRKDTYGGSLENRMRFLVEICEKTRQVVGKAFPILVKLTCTEFFEGGLSVEETKVIAKKLEEIGVDGIELTGNIHGKANQLVGETFENHQIRKEGFFAEYTEEISRTLKLPIIAVGGFRSIEAITSCIEEGTADFVALSRPLLAEPDLVKRWHAGDVKKAICVSCSKCRTPEGNYCTIFKKSDFRETKK